MKKQIRWEELAYGVIHGYNESGELVARINIGRMHVARFLPDNTQDSFHYGSGLTYISQTWSNFKSKRAIKKAKEWCENKFIEKYMGEK